MVFGSFVWLLLLCIGLIQVSVAFPLRLVDSSGLSGWFSLDFRYLPNERLNLTETKFRCQSPEGMMQVESLNCYVAGSGSKKGVIMFTATRAEWKR